MVYVCKNELLWLTLSLHIRDFLMYWNFPISILRKRPSGHTKHRSLINISRTFCQWFWCDAVFHYSLCYGYHPHFFPHCIYMYTKFKLHAAWKHLATSKQAGNEGYLKLQIYTCQLEEERSKLTQHNFFCTHGLPYRSSNSIVMRVHNNNYYSTCNTHAWRHTTVPGMENWS